MKTPKQSLMQFKGGEDQREAYKEFMRGWTDASSRKSIASEHPWYQQGYQSGYDCRARACRLASQWTGHHPEKIKLMEEP